MGPLTFDVFVMSHDEGKCLVSSDTHGDARKAFQNFVPTPDDHQERQEKWPNISRCLEGWVSLTFINLLANL